MAAAAKTANVLSFPSNLEIDRHGATQGDNPRYRRISKYYIERESLSQGSTLLQKEELLNLYTLRSCNEVPEASRETEMDTLTDLNGDQRLE